MRSFSCRFFFAALFAIGVTGCANGREGLQLPPAASPTTAHHASAKETVVYRFKGDPDGSEPESSLLNVNGTLYGTTYSGGSSKLGTVFSISDGTETVLHSFAGSPDGSYPEANLIDVGGTLYGTALGGGTNDEGIVYEIAASGSESVLYNFAGGATDGANPQAGLIEIHGKLYGTTGNGGDGSGSGDGTVFKITTSGAETVLHFFDETDGAYPLVSLDNARRTLYGTTFYGGANRHGTIFKLARNGHESTLHSFDISEGGSASNLIRIRDEFYGTTGIGGTSGFGTVFKISKTGTYTLLHNFTGGYSDGAYPSGGLLEVNGTLYGTTYQGGDGSSAEFGTVYSITKTGKESVIYRFAGGTDGANPSAGLIDVNGTLYGTTAAGGGYGDGTVFSISSS